MAKTTIKGRFATGADVATVHQISAARQQWLDRAVSKATEEAVILFTPLASKTTKPEKRSGKTAVLRAKKK